MEGQRGTCRGSTKSEKKSRRRLERLQQKNTTVINTSNIARGTPPQRGRPTQRGFYSKKGVRGGKALFVPPAKKEGGAIHP